MLSKVTDFVDGLNRQNKWFILIFIDTLVMIFALILAFCLRHGEFPVEVMKKAWPLFSITVLAGIAYNWMLGIPKIKLQSFDIQDMQRIALCSLLLVLTAMSLSYLFKFYASRSIPIIFGILYFAGSLSFRVNSLMLLRLLYQLGQKRTPILIYGAGDAGVQLMSALRQSKEVKPIAFVDDNKLQQKLIIFGLSVYDPSKIEELVKRRKVERILISIPSISDEDQKAISKRLAYLPCTVQIMPSHIDIIQGKNILDSFVSVNPDDLLGRDKFDIVLPNIDVPYKSKSILVSGAGGSIGLELCRQVLKHNPSKLVLFERSELALYKAERDLRPIAATAGIKLVPVLGSVCDAKMVKHTFDIHNIDTVLHAAAYKHVPLVEANEVSGIQNNVIGTYTVAKQAKDSKIETFILISTDKAVRPTNVMGASKRLSELVIQDFDKHSKETKFSMVRFGNVLGSSGSVIPLFKEQIAKGGPITLTHDEVTRYFMAISEAAYLVIVAGSFAKGGEVFVLDMGSPVKIKDLARSIIEKSGLTVRDDDNPNGDIEIVTTGLRPGEKLYEELLIDAETLSTPHPKIMCAKEGSLSSKEVSTMIKRILKLVADNNDQEARKVIVDYVKGYHNGAQ